MKLLIISEVDVDTSTNSTRNRSFNAIIREYSKYFDEVHVIGPGVKDDFGVNIPNTNIYLSSTGSYNKKITRRLKYIMNLSLREGILDFIKFEVKPDIIQYRLPSIFTMGFYKDLKNYNAAKTSYIAGDWGSSFRNNYRVPLMGTVLDYSQRHIIKATIAVSAGDTLANKYAGLNSVYPYYSTTHTTINSKEKRNDGILRCVFVGRLEGLKRVEDALNALADAQNRGLKFEFVVCGDGPRRGLLESLAKELGISDYCFFMGYVSDVNKLNSIYEASDVLIFPSASEGTPKVITEAMSFGVIPIAVSTTGSIANIITHSVNGFLVTLASPLDISNTIMELSSNEVLRERVRFGALAYAEKRTMTNEIGKMWNHIFTEANLR